MCIDAYMTIHSNVLCVCPLINDTLATEENVLNVREKNGDFTDLHNDKIQSGSYV